MQEKIILFDGVCNLCNGSVQFVIKKDHQKFFKFAALQSDFAQDFLDKQGLNPNELKSIILIDGEQVYTQSDAALNILKALKGYQFTAKFLLLFPRFLRDFVYRIIAKNRYQWFGKKQQCMVPTPELRSRFL